MNRILIMDQNLDRLKNLGRTLWYAGHDLSFVQDEELLWRRLKVLSFDLVIFSADLPISRGNALCTRFQEEYGRQGIPLIVLLSSDSPSSPGMWLEHGVSDYLREPWDSRELLGKIAKNIRDREQIHYLMERNYLLEKSNKEKDRFFSILSHDLKAPFQGLVGLLEILYGEYDSLNPEEVRDYIHNIHDSTKRTYRLLENLLDWSGFQSGRLRWIPQELDLKILVEDTLGLFTLGARDKGVELRSTVPPGFTVFADQRMIESVLRNLIYNGVKFSETGGEVLVQARESVDYYEVMVDDHGMGIQKDALARILNQGLVDSSPGTAMETGTGLGLQLCIQFIEKHGGQFWIRSEPGRGSSVRFSLPKRRVHWGGDNSSGSETAPGRSSLS